MFVCVFVYNSETAPVVMSVRTEFHSIHSQPQLISLIGSLQTLNAVKTNGVHHLSVHQCIALSVGQYVPKGAE